MIEGRLDDYRQVAGEMAAVWRAHADRARLAVSLASSAMGRALEGTETTLAVAEVEEALALARDVAAPSVSAVVLANAAFVLADSSPNALET